MPLFRSTRRTYKPRTYTPRRRPLTGSRKVKTSYRKSIKAPQRKSLPSRFYGASSTQYRTTKAVSRAISQVAETYYNPFTDVVEQSVDTATSSSDVLSKKYTLGETVPTHLDDYNALGGMNFSGAHGQYVYLKKSQCLLTVEMNPAASADSLTYCRLIVFKNKRSISPAGLSVNPNLSLYLSNNGTFIGQDTTGSFDSKIMMNAKLNKQNFLIFRDHKFTLSNPYITPTGDRAYHSKYPIQRKFQINMPFFKKVKLNADHEPTDVDYHWNILLLVGTQGSAGTPNDVLVSMNNNLTTWTDI